MNKLVAITLSVLAGIFAGCVIAVLVTSFRMPLFYSNSWKALIFSFKALTIVIFLYQSVPLVTLALLAGFSRRHLTLFACIVVSLCWPMLFFAFWHRHAIINEGIFPLWAIQRDFIPLLAISLATALGFWWGWSRIVQVHRMDFLR